MAVYENDAALKGELYLLYQQESRIIMEKVASNICDLESCFAVLIRRGNPEIPAARRVRRPYPKVRPKYRNPESPNETWSGRGKSPRWLAAAIAGGKRMDDFKI